MSEYPKYIDHPELKDESGKWPTRVIVQDADEEAELLGTKKKKSEKEKPDNWGK